MEGKRFVGADQQPWRIAFFLFLNFAMFAPLLQLFWTHGWAAARFCGTSLIRHPLSLLLLLNIPTPADAQLPLSRRSAPMSPASCFTDSISQSVCGRAGSIPGVLRIR